MISRYAWTLCLMTACAGSVTQDPPLDPGMIPDASTDAPVTLIIGHPCSADAECGGGEVICHAGWPDGYCSSFCASNADCPSGSLCSPIPFSRVPSGICMKSCTIASECRAGYACGTVYHFPGQPNSPSSSAPVCWVPQNAQP